MAAAPKAFPAVDTAAMTAAAGKLQKIAGQMSDTGVNLGVLQTEVTGNESWKGQGATAWQTVMSSRVADADLSNEVLSKGGTLLSQLAADLQTEQRYYNKINGELQDRAGSYNPRFNPAPPGDWEAPYISAMNASVTRASNLLTSFGNDCQSLAALAAGITATTAANRTPGEPQGPGGRGGTTVLTALAGTVTGGDSPGADDSGITDEGFEDEVLSELGLSKNTATIGRGLVPGKLTKGGQPRGAIPDSLSGSDNYVVELKNVSSLSARTQIRIEAAYARLTGSRYWVVVPKDAKVNDNVTDLAEQTGGGVIYRTDAGNGKITYEDPSGNPVQIGPKMQVSGYQPSTTGPGSGSPGAGPPAATSDPQAPSQPVDPSDTAGQPPAGTGGDGGDGGFGGDGDPDPDPDPFIDPLP